MKGLKVFELTSQGYTYRKIAKILHLSLRDVSKFINLATDRTRFPATTSIHDLIILEYQVSNYRRELGDMIVQKENLINEVRDLRAQKDNLLNQVRAKKIRIRWRENECGTRKVCKGNIKGRPILDIFP